MAAKDVRVKELEQINADLCRSHGVLNVAGAKLEKKIETLEAKLTAAEKTDFEHGYVLACCNIVNLHDEPTIAHDTLSELGVTRAAIKAMNLSEFDLKALRKIEGGCPGSPYAKTKRKARAVLEVKS
ncbi:hypothetical protein [Brucella anthropi]|uniref:hypothetical protein n=1 Tax=Brucella anthropi TaxID=529 RepID=UPI000775120A|nr:hypothetical protein [Brucella anthropi]KXO77803.1 hypothetical protein AYJ56_18865 [Brucella anthropi]